MAWKASGCCAGRRYTTRWRRYRGFGAFGTPSLRIASFCTRADHRVGHRRNGPARIAHPHDRSDRRGDRARSIPAVAEEYGLITDIDGWVIQQAAQLAADGHHVGINLSAHSLSTAQLADRFEDVLRRTGADPALITIELTETPLVKDEQAAAGFIERIGGLGCKLALDDFGTGYASFTYLKRLPVDYLKIDCEFVRDVVDNPAGRHVVDAVVRLARDFGQQTIRRRRRGRTDPVRAEGTRRRLRAGICHHTPTACGRGSPAPR
jgi:predicted signal transduction protein with EAL and GGDEF domain